MAICLVCHASENLNTNMTVNIGDIKCNIYLCDEHAENTTMKQLKNILVKIKTEMEQSVALAMAVGIPIPTSDVSSMNINQTTDNSTQEHLVTPTVSTDSIEAVQPQEATDTLEDTPDQTQIRIDEQKPAIQPQNRQRVSLIPDNVIKSSKDLSQINIKEEAEVAEVVGRGGRPINIPKRISGDLGTTDIRIVKTSDSVLQQRFKNLDVNSPDVRQGYAPCPLCKGSGVDFNNNICAKCRGSGVRP